MILCIDPGHGGKDPGATNSQYLEKDFNLIFAKMLRDKLKIVAPNIETILTRNADTYVTLENRTKIANSNNATLFISIHINAGMPTASGIETLAYYLEGDTGRLARNIQNCVIAATNAIDRGVKHRNDLYVLKYTKMPAVLIECGFIVADIQKLLDKNYQNKIIDGICNGIVKTVGGVNLSESKSSLEILREKNIISDIEYWKNAVKCVKYLDILIDKVAEYVLK